MLLLGGGRWVVGRWWVVSASPSFFGYDALFFLGNGNGGREGLGLGLTHDIGLDGVVGETSTDGLSCCGSIEDDREVLAE